MAESEGSAETLPKNIDFDQEVEKITEQQEVVNLLNSTRKIEAAIEATQRRKISRRDFLKAAGITTAAIGLEKALRPAKPKEAKFLQDYPHQEVEFDRRQLAQIIGLEPRNFGFEPMMQITNPERKYIIHIGQIHKGKDFYGFDQIVKTQQNIESLLSFGKFDGVFLEGKSVETIDYFYAFRAMKNKVFDQIPVDENTWYELLKRYGDVRERFADDPTTTTLLDYIMAEKSKYFEEQFQNQNFNFDQEAQKEFVLGYDLCQALSALIPSDISFVCSAIFRIGRLMVEETRALKITEIIKSNMNIRILQRVRYC